MSPDSLIDRYGEFFPRAPDLRELLDGIGQVNSPGDTLVMTDFPRKIDELWSRLSPHDFMSALKEYHWHMWREGIETAPLNVLVGLIQFERSVGFPLNPETLVEAYKKAQYGFVLKTIKGNDQLNKAFKVELFAEPVFPESGSSCNSTVSIEPNWENLWGDYKKKGDIPIFWYVHRDDSTLQHAIYQGAILLRKGKTLYYDRHPMSGGPFKIRSFSDKAFRNRAELIADHVERAVKNGSDTEVEIA